jgi:hypothetical protein
LPKETPKLPNQEFTANETSVDENENKIPSMYVKNVNKRLLSECYVKTKCLDEEVASKHLDTLTAYEDILEEQRLNHEEKTAYILIGEGFWFKLKELTKRI